MFSLHVLTSFCIIVAVVANCYEDKLTKKQLDELHSKLKEAGCHKDASLIEFSKFQSCYVGKPAESKENPTACKPASKYDACGSEYPEEVGKLYIGGLQKACLTVGTDKIDGLTKCIYETKKKSGGPRFVDQYKAALKRVKDNCLKK